MTAASALELIGRTPIVEVTHLDSGRCKLFLKLENQNPGGSIKDRMALSMVQAAERDGLLPAGGLLVEATAGNTGLGLALVAGQKGYRLLLVIPDKMALEKIHHLRALGAEVVITRSDVGKGHPEYYQDLAERLAREREGFYVNQFGNPANPLAHETTTGPELWQQMEGKLDAVVCGVGSGGTLTGVGRYLRRVAPHVQMVLADPAGSVLEGYFRTGKVGRAGSWLVEGIGEDFIPPNCDMSLVRAAYEVSDDESLHSARELLRAEGILGGSSTGTLLAAALRYCREQTEPRRVLTFVCDSGNKYLSKMFNDAWMIEHGMMDRPRFGDLRDLVPRTHASNDTVVVGPGDTLLTAFRRMRAHDVSQLPVLDGDGAVVGIVDESDVLVAVYGHPKAFWNPVASAMTTGLETVDSATPIESLVPIFDRGHVAIVKQEQQFVGLITRVDLLNHLRRKMP